MLTEQSVGKLLIAGMVPGLILAAAYIAIVIVKVKLRPELAPSSPEPVSWRDRIRALSGIWETLAIFIVVMGGIYIGIFTPTEAGAVGATLLFATALVKRRLNWVTLLDALKEAMRVPGTGSLLGGRDGDFEVRDPRHHRSDLSVLGLFPRCHIDDGPNTSGDLPCDTEVGLGSG